MAKIIYIKNGRRGSGCLHRQTQDLKRDIRAFNFILHFNHTENRSFSDTMAVKCAFFVLVYFFVFVNGLGRFKSKFQSKMHVIERFEDTLANELLNLNSPKVNLKVRQVPF